MNEICQGIECCDVDPFAYTGNEIVAWCIGDFGDDGADEQSVAEYVVAQEPDIIVLTGDNSYSGNYANDVGHDYGGVVARNKMIPCPGNHDWDYNYLADYLGYFAGILGLARNGQKRYYSMRFGPIEFFMLDSDGREPDGNTEGSDQEVWFRGKVAASQAFWKVSVGHHPPYSSDDTHGPTPAMQWDYPDIGVHAHLAGHAHDYERIIKDGFPYIVNGLGGVTKRGFGTIDPDSVVRYNASYGAMRISASSSTLNFRFYSAAGVKIDDYTLTK